jgi:glycosyltransferase involved in cell wall biosynthesis
MGIQSSALENDFSIIIPCKNEENYIGNLLESIQNQTVVNSQTPIFIADANSTDNTLSIINSYKEKLNIKVIEGGYPSVGRNRGAALAKTKYLLFLDADVRLGGENFIKKAINLANHKDLFLVTSYIKCPEGNLFDKFFWLIYGLFLIMNKIVGPVSAGMMMFCNREFFNSVGGFDEHIILGEDVEMAKAAPRNKFGVINAHILIDNRRFQKMGYIKTILSYVLAFSSKKFRYRQNTYYFK